MAEYDLRMAIESASPPGFRERKRLAAQRDIGEVAMRLFLDQGFEETTIDQISSAAGLSSRSFFRYFATKEDVVLGHLAEAGRQLQSALVERPARESPWVALRAAFDTLLKEYDDSPEVLRSTARMLQETPSLRARHLEKQLQWQELLVPDIARRLGVAAEHPDGAGAHAVVASALACLDAASAAWAAASDEVPIGAILDDAIAAVRR
jgi:AcrR family transcriptional regulator